MTSCFTIPYLLTTMGRDILLGGSILSTNQDFENSTDEISLDPADLTIFNLAAHIANQNKLRSQYFRGLEFGDPVWDILLDIYVSENLDRPTTLDAIAERQDQSRSLCSRCIDYLVERGAVFTNNNQYTAPKFRFLASEKTKQEIKAWMTNCISSTPQF